MRRNNLAFSNPWMMWADFTVKAAEMMLASNQVIGVRVNRMAQAGSNPTARDRKEFMLMGTEKVRAASESALAMSGAMMRLWQPWTGSLGSLSRLSTSTAKVASAGLKPVHSAATRNARRLSRSSGRTRRSA